MGISKINFGTKTLIDLTSDTVTAQSLKAGYTAHGADGEPIEGVLGKELTFAPGTTLTINVALSDADGKPYTMAAGEVLKLHMWHGADVLDAQGSTTALSVEVPSDAAEALWHYWVRLEKNGKMYLAALGDAKCTAGGDSALEIAGTVADSREWVTSGKWSSYAFTSQATNISSWNYAAWAGVAFADLPQATSIGNSAFNTCTSLASVDLPQAASIDAAAFYQARQLETLTLGGSKVCTLGGTNSFQFTSLQAVYVPDALVDEYKAATNWTAYASYIKPLSEKES